MIGVPTMATASEVERQSAIAIVTAEISITVKGRTVFVYGANGMDMEIVSVTGGRVKVITIDSPSQRIELNIPKGCYLIKVGDVVRKVTIS